MQNIKLLSKLFVILGVTLVCTCCQDENVHSIMGVKVTGYSWSIKQAFLSKGFEVVKETEDVIFMDGKYNDDLRQIFIYKGKWNRVIAVNMRLGLLNYSLDKQYEELLRELSSEYGDAQYNYEDDKQKVRVWEMYSNGELTSKMELTANITSRESGFTIDFPEYEFIDPKNPNKTAKKKKEKPKPLIITRISSISLTVYNSKNIEEFSKKK